MFCQDEYVHKMEAQLWLGMIAVVVRNLPSCSSFALKFSESPTRVKVKFTVLTFFTVFKYPCD